MAIVVDPAYTPPAPPEVITSPDGILTARVDAAHAGVLLTANYSTDATVAKVRFHRGDGTTVRSGDTAWAPGGWANAYDHEAPLGVGVSWYAVPIGFDGIERTPSALVAAEVPAPGWGLWVKSTFDPDASMLLEVLAGTRPHARRARNTFSDVPGAALSVASWDRRGGIEMQVQLRTNTAAESEAFGKLLDSGPLLVQPALRYALPDLYVLAGDEEWDYENDAASAHRRVWTLSLTEIARPATLGAPLMIPGRSWDQVAGGYASWDDLAAQVASWNALLGARRETTVTTNLVTNPSLEVNQNSWGTWFGSGAGAGTVTRETTGGKIGQAFRRITWTTPPTSGGGHLYGPLLPVAAGQPVAGGAWLRPSVALSIAAQCGFYAGGASVAGGEVMPAVACPANVWTWVPFEFTPPAGADGIQVRWYVAGAGITAAGQTLDIDAAIVGADTYFDGDTPDTSVGGVVTAYAWTGTPHASTSTKTVSRPV